MIHSVIIPQLGATGGDVTIVEWRVSEGQKVKAGDVLFVIETDKATEDIPAFRDGYVRKILAGVGSDLEPGAVAALMTDAADEAVILPTEEPVATATPPVASQPVDSPAIATRPIGLSPRQRAFAGRTLQAKPIQPLEVAAEVDQALSQSCLLDVFRKMALIRRYEEHLYQLFLQGLVPGTLHQCQGQEAVAVGVCSALRRDDWIYSTHRPVGHLIAKGASLNAITAEIWGKATGCVGGKGGQMHLADFSVGAMVSNAIVGANIPIATGSAMAFRMQGLDRVAVSFFGDGASNIGAFHEGLNMAAVQNAPVIFVCENNLYAASTHISSTTRITDIADRAAAYGMPGFSVDGMNVEAVFTSALAAVERARKGRGPTLLEYKTYRYRGHSRGDPCGYRQQQEHREWSDRDPLEQSRARLTNDFGVDAERLIALEQACQSEVEAAVAYAVASADPSAESSLEHVFATNEV